MYNIIRGIPLYYRGQNGKLVWWMEVRRHMVVACSRYMVAACSQL
jgi:hypothetical protein